jgi:hypothetical protein
MLASLATLLVLAGPAAAGQKVTAESVSDAIAFDPGTVAVTRSGNLHFTGMRSVNIVLSDNPLATGRLTCVGDFQGDAELNGAGHGKGIFEVGTWDFSPDVPVFTRSPAGGLWVTTWQSQGNLLGPFDVNVVGHGVAGEVEGMQFQAEAQGDAGTGHYAIQLLDPHAKK